MTSLHVAYVGAFAYPTGYGEAARAHAKALRSAGVVVTARLNARIPRGLEDELVTTDDAVNEMLDQRFWPTEPGLRDPHVWIWHVTPDSWRPDPPGVPHLGYAAWECQGLPDGWAEACNRMDGLLVPSRFTAEIFRAGGVTVPIEVCPHPIDVDRFSSADGSSLRSQLGSVRTVFLVVSQWMPRKGVEDALVAYAAEFRPDEPVALMLVVWRWSHAVRERDACKQFASFVLRGLNRPTPPVWFIGEMLPVAAMPQVYAAADVLVVPSRGEAFCLPVFEAAAAYRPAIATGWGGMWDYLDETCAYPVAYDLETVHGMGSRWRHYHAGQRWARPRLDDLRRAMREAHDDPTALKRKGMAARKVAERLAPGVQGPAMRDVIRKFVVT
jgi:glycosyltransferase involved in cell wall biosynthesis